MTKSKCLLLILLTIVSLSTSTQLLAQKATTKKETIKSVKPLYEKYIEDNMDAHLKEFVELVSIPSISSIPANKPDVAKTGAWIVNKLKSIGITTAALLPSAGNPVVYGSWDKAPGKPTVLIYAHYDVQPVKESEWDNPPFAPFIKDGKIFGRGASDDKSGVMISMLAVEAMLKTTGKLPVM